MKLRVDKDLEVSLDIDVDLSWENGIDSRGLKDQQRSKSERQRGRTQGPACEESPLWRRPSLLTPFCAPFLPKQHLPGSYS